MLFDASGYDVAIAAITAVSAIVAAVCAAVVAVRTKTTNGTRIGEAVSKTQAHTADTNARVRRAMGDEPEADA